MENSKSRDRKAYQQAYYQKNREAILARTKANAAKPGFREQKSEYHKQYTQRPEVIDKRRRTDAEYKVTRGKQAIRMQRRLGAAIKDGRFPNAKVQVCADQDATCYGRMEYYFRAYDRWDNVIPLCCSHHRRRDKANPKT